MIELMRYEVRRDSDDAVMFSFVRPPGTTVIWNPPEGFDPRWPNGYHWRTYDSIGELGRWPCTSMPPGLLR